MIIEQPAIYLRWLYPKAYWRMDRHERAVYLTFDDGPIPEATPFILETLKKFDAKATFFMVGDNVRNHTHNHIVGFGHTIKEYSYNVEKANAYIHSHYVRPPHGWMRMGQYAWLSRKYKIVMWDLVSRDYSKWLTAEDVVNNIKKFTRNGSIITFHDSLKSIEKLHTALPESLQWLRDEGYEFKVFP